MIPPYTKAYLPHPGCFTSLNAIIEQQCPWLRKSWDESDQKRGTAEHQKTHIATIANEYSCPLHMAYFISWVSHKTWISEAILGTIYMFANTFLMTFISILMLCIAWLSYIR